MLFMKVILKNFLIYKKNKLENGMLKLNMLEHFN